MGVSRTKFDLWSEVVFILAGMFLTFKAITCFFRFLWTFRHVALPCFLVPGPFLLPETKIKL